MLTKEKTMDIAPYDPQGLHIKFLTSIGGDNLKKIAAVVAWAHLRAPVIGQERWGDVGLSRWGLIRWIQIDADLLTLNGKLDGVSVEWADNIPGPGKHLEIIAGDFRVLIAHDPDPHAVVPISDYGKTLATTNIQSLFPEHKAAQQATCYYAVLFHSKSESKFQIPNALEVRFPDGEDGYACDHMKLYPMFSQLMDDAWLLQTSLEWSPAPVAKEEKIKEEAMPKLRESGEIGA